MKIKFTLLSVFMAVIFNSSAQQIPNGGFENWSNAVTPTYWTGIEDILQSPNNIFTFKDTVDFYEGHSSLKLISDSLASMPANGVIAGLISLGSGSLSNGLSFHGIPFTFRPDTFFFDYKYTSPGIDTAVLGIELSQGGMNPVLVAHFYLTPTSVWSPSAIPLAQFYDTVNPLIPDTLLIQFSAGHRAPVKSTTLHVDGLRFGYVPVPAPLTATILTPGGNTVFCTGDSLLLQANTGNGYSYQWGLDSTAITGATNSSYSAKTAGLYSVTIDSAGIHASTFVHITDTVCITGIQTPASAHISVYPNPANHILNIHSSISLSGCKLQILDVPGREVMREVLDNNNGVVSIDNLSNGTYFYRITDKESNLVVQDKFNILK